MKFLLIYWLIAGPTNFAPTGTAVFDDKPACDAALQAIAQTFQADTKGAPGVCVAQASEEPDPAPKLASAPQKAVAPVARK